MSGTLAIVSSNTNTEFTIRAIDNLGNIRDRTFIITVSGTAIPIYWFFNGVLLSTQDSIWTQLQLEYSSSNYERSIVELQQGYCSGLQISTTGLIQGCSYLSVTEVILIF
jgi:hypothetical protein